MKSVSVKTIKSWLISSWPYLAIVIIEIFLFITNYKSGTNLVGWDNLFPEFNFPVNFTRSVNAVWQEYRGMGVIDSMSHASTIIEDVERFMLALVLPNELVRWAYLLILHLIGGLGVVKILKIILNKSKSVDSEQIINIVALTAAIFYQFNLGTIQQFYLPMEVFIVHFAYFPWLLWAASEIFKKCSRKNILIFAALSLLATPQAHVPTLFIVFSMAIGILILSKIITLKSKAIKPAIIIVSAIFVTNAFWLMPFGYATLTHSKEVATSKAFEMASNDIFYRNHKYGDIKNIALIKGSLLEYFYYDFQNNENHYMFKPWLRHVETPAFQFVAYAFFALAILGLIFAALHKDRYIMPYALLFVFSIFMLGTNIPVLGSLNFLLRNNIPLFATVFRFVFTKFSIIYALSFAIMLGYGIFSVAQIAKRKQIMWTIAVLAMLCSLWYASPAFQKAFFYRNLKVELPKKYKQTFDFFKSQDPAGRVAMLPIPWYWAWVQPDWGTINSGFLWYAIPQPTTDLAFTPWGKNNENFYWELNQALIEQNTQDIENVFEKYDITWIYFDKSILNAQSRKLTNETTEEMLLKSGKIKKVIDFDEISIYKHNQDSVEKSFVNIVSGVPEIAYQSASDDNDSTYSETGGYIRADDIRNANAIVPFKSLFSGKRPVIKEFNITENKEYFSLESPLQIESSMLKNYSLIPPDNSGSDEHYIVDIDGKEKPIRSSFMTKNGANDKAFFAYQIDKKSSQIYNSNDDIWFTNQTNDFCPNTPENAKYEKIKINGNTAFRLTSVNTNNCIRVAIPSLLHRFGYVVRIEYEADLQRGWFLNIYNTSTNKSIHETYLEKNGKKNVEYLVLTPGEKYGMGYTMYFNNKSEGVEKVTNSLINVSVYQIPYKEIKSRVLVNNVFPFSGNNDFMPELITEVEHPNPAFYKITLGTPLSKNDYLYLSQSFDEGWVAYASDSLFFPFFGNKLDTHVLINNWANGWKIESNNHENIVIVFWPQYFEYLGFAILILASSTFVLFLRRK